MPKVDTDLSDEDVAMIRRLYFERLEKLAEARIRENTARNIHREMRREVESLQTEARKLRNEARYLTLERLAFKFDKPEHHIKQIVRSKA